MIALPAISQKRYIIGNDTCTCYTNEENRTIAIIMVEGDRDHELLQNRDSLVTILSLKCSALESKNNTSTKMIDKLVNYNRMYAVKVDSLTTEVHKTNRKVKLVSGIAIVLIILRLL